MHSVAFSTAPRPRGLDLVPQHAPPLSSSCWHQPGAANSTTPPGLEAEQAQGRWPPPAQQTAADDHAAAGLGAGIADGGGSPGAIDEAALPLMTGDGGTKGTGRSPAPGGRKGDTARRWPASGVRAGISHAPPASAPVAGVMPFSSCLGGIRHAQCLGGRRQTPRRGAPVMAESARRQIPSPRTGVRPPRATSCFDEVMAHHAVAFTSSRCFAVCSALNRNRFFSDRAGPCRHYHPLFSLSVMSLFLESQGSGAQLAAAPARLPLRGYLALLLVREAAPAGAACGSGDRPPGATCLLPGRRSGSPPTVALGPLVILDDAIESSTASSTSW